MAHIYIERKYNFSIISKSLRIKLLFYVYFSQSFRKTNLFIVFISKTGFIMSGFSRFVLWDASIITPQLLPLYHY